MNKIGRVNWSAASAAAVALLLAPAIGAQESAERKQQDEVVVHNGQEGELPRSQAPGEGTEGRAWVDERHRQQPMADPKQRDDGPLTRERDDVAEVRRHELRPGMDIAQAPVGAVRGARVVNQRGDELGTVLELVVDREQETLHAVVDVGPLLGITGRQVALPVDRLEIRSAHELTYPVQQSEEELIKQAEDYRRQQDRYVAIDEPRLPVSALLEDAPKG